MGKSKVKDFNNGGTITFKVEFEYSVDLEGDFTEEEAIEYAKYQYDEMFRGTRAMRQNSETKVEVSEIKEWD